MSLDIPVRINTYPGLKYKENYIRFESNEIPVNTEEMSEQLFLELCLICSKDDLKEFSLKHPEFRFVNMCGGFVKDEHYYRKAFYKLDTIKAAYKLLLISKTIKPKSYFRIAAFINRHENLSAVLNPPLACEALSIEACGSSLKDIDNSEIDYFDYALDVAFNNLIVNLERRYLSDEPCDTLEEAMWRFGYKLVFVQELSCRRCEKRNCKEYFLLNKLDKQNRKYCAKHKV